MKNTIPDLEAAIALAAIHHAGQVDKAGQPYILHPLRVMLKLEGDCGRIVAVLHDTVEDTALTLDEIRNTFGDHVADAVDALTRRNGEEYEDFIDRCGANSLARSVKLADLGDNMDVSRLDLLTDADHARIAKYQAAAVRLSARAVFAS